MSCPDCFKGSVHDHGTAKGNEAVIHGRRTYVAGSSQITAPKSAILFLTDAFGLELVNNKLLADRYAEATGCKVLVPDIISPAPLPVSAMALVDILLQPAGFNLFAQFNRVWILLRLMFMGIPWMIRAQPRKSFANILEYARAMRADLPEGGKLGVCGFCWGGYGSTLLCGETATPGGSQPLIDAQFNAHPSFLTLPGMIVDSIKKFKVPYSSAVAEKDQMLSEKEALKVEADLRNIVGSPEQNNYEFVIYKDCKHGFAVRCDPKNDKVEGQAAEDAAQQAIDWFNRFLK